MKLSVALRLGRVSNLPTVWSNVLAGLVLAGQGGGALASFWLVVGFSALYTAGMYLNDAFDAKFDRIHRPERPIPSGEASAMSVFVAGFAMLAMGLAIVGAVALLRLGPDSKPAIFSAVGLAAVIVLYDAWHKRNPLGPALMGLCRLLVYCTTALAIAGLLSWSVLSAALAAFCYLIGLTYIAKQETLGRLTNLWPLGFLAVPFVYEVLEATPGTDCDALVDRVVRLDRLRSLPLAAADARDRQSGGIPDRRDQSARCDVHCGAAAAGAGSGRGAVFCSHARVSAVGVRHMTAKSLSRADAILARLEQMPFTRFHMRLRLIVGAATFFDLFDAIMIAFVAPALIRPWSLSPPQIGLLISAAYAGQFVGALFFGWLAGRIGRRRTILLTTVCYGIGSLLVAGAWDFESMLVLRALQGIGLGGEVPVASAYLSEWIAADVRGRYVAFFELTAPVGILAAGLLGAWVVPEFGWRWMFVIGAIPALLVFPLRRQMPESPRHLMRMGKFDEAERIVAEIEREPTSRFPQPPRPEFQPAPDRPRSGRFRQISMVGSLWFCCYFINYGLTGWLPSIYRSVYHLDVGASLRYGLATSAAGVVGAILCGLLIDRIGRRISVRGGVPARRCAARRAGLDAARRRARSTGARLAQLRICFRLFGGALSLYARNFSDP